VLHIKCAQFRFARRRLVDALVSWAQKKAMNDREFGVKENAKKTGAFDDIFGMLVEGAGCKGGFRSVSARLVTKECEATSERRAQQHYTLVVTSEL